LSNYNRESCKQIEFFIREKDLPKSINNRYRLFFEFDEGGFFERSLMKISFTDKTGKLIIKDSKVEYNKFKLSTSFYNNIIFETKNLVFPLKFKFTSENPNEYVYMKKMTLFNYVFIEVQ
jgi:hypothetical protein